MNIVQHAGIYQRAAHDAMGQVRKFSGLPYHTHPEAVLGILCQNVSALSVEMMAAALLHDVLEDTRVTEAALRKEFGDEVTRLVVGLTNWKPTPGTFGVYLNRAARHRLNVRRLSSECDRVKTIKLADCLHNLPDIIENDPKHAKVYVPEKRILLDEALSGGDFLLWSQVDKVICDYYVANPPKVVAQA